MFNNITEDKTFNFDVDHDIRCPVSTGDLRHQWRTVPPTISLVARGSQCGGKKGNY